MRKKVVCFLFFSLFIVIGIIVGLGSLNKLYRISWEIGVHISDGSIIEEKDDHGGFHGDGLEVVKIKIDEEDFASKLEASNRWNKNMSKVVQAFLYGFDENNAGFGPFISDEDDNPLIPKFERAYYFFKDRGEGNDPEDLSLLYEGAFRNVTIAVYDIDTSMLYYCEDDS